MAQIRSKSDAPDRTATNVATPSDRSFEASGNTAPFTSDDRGPRRPRRAGRPAESMPRLGTEHELTEELDGMAAALGEVDPRAAERLSDLSQSIGTEEGRSRWSDVDLSRAFNSERLAHAYALRREGGYSPASIEVATRVRDVLVLLPLLLTWLAFYEASRAYDAFIQNNPDQVRAPFLLLWQRGFGGEGSLLANSFSTVALIDVVLIALIILLTFYSQGKRDQREDQIARTASVFQTDLDNVMGAATVALASDRSTRPALLARAVERLAERFDHSTRELLTRLRIEHDRLETITDRREREFADFGVFASGMRAGAEETHRLLLDLRQVSTGLTESLEDLTSEVSVTGDQQRSLLNAVTNLERLTDSSVRSDQAVTRRLAEAAESLAGSSDRAQAGADAAAQAGRVAAEAVRGIAELTDSLATSQARVEDAISDGAETNARLAEALTNSAGGVNDSTRQLNQIGAGLAQLQLEFSRIAEQTESQTHHLSDLLQEQHDVAGGISQVARDLSAVGIATAQRQREVSDDLSGLLRRLDDLTATIARSGPNPSPQAAPADPSAAWPARPPRPQPSEPDQAADRPTLWPRGQRRPNR